MNTLYHLKPSQATTSYRYFPPSIRTLGILFYSVYVNFFLAFRKGSNFFIPQRRIRKQQELNWARPPLQKKKTYQPVIFMMMMMAMMIRRFMSSCISRLYSEFKFSVRDFIFPYFGAKTECMCVSVAKLSHVLTTDYRMSATLAKR